MLRLSPKELERFKRVSRLTSRTEIGRKTPVGSLLESDRERYGESCEIGWLRDNREVSAGGIS